MISKGDNLGYPFPNQFLRTIKRFLETREAPVTKIL